MRHLNKTTEKDYITFDSDSDNNNNNYNRYENFEDAKKKLIEELGKNKGIYSDIPLRITIHSHFCIDGILIDLPGFPEKSIKLIKNIYNLNNYLK